MKQTEHTPGPWYAKKGYGHSYILQDGRTADGEAIAACYQHAGRGADEERANARLIAAAPDLLAASRAIEELIWEYGIGDSDRVVEPVVARFRAAIAQAEGEVKP